MKHFIWADYVARKGNSVFFYAFYTHTFCSEYRVGKIKILINWCEGVDWLFRAQCIWLLKRATNRMCTPDEELCSAELNCCHI